MRLAPALVLALGLLPPAAALAHDHHLELGDIATGGVHAPVRWTDRRDGREARLAIQTRERTVALLFTGHDVVLQLSDATMHRVDRELERSRHEDDDDDGGLGDVIRAAVIGGVRGMLERALACPVDEIRDARVRDGRLELVTWDGERLFDGVRVDGQQVMERFDPRDAQVFVDAIHRRSRR